MLLGKKLQQVCIKSLNYSNANKMKMNTPHLSFLVDHQKCIFKDQMTILLPSQRQHITESSINNRTGHVQYAGPVVISQPCIENDG